mgnify:CR=1 FL=1
MVKSRLAVLAIATFFIALILVASVRPLSVVTVKHYNEFGEGATISILEPRFESGYWWEYEGAAVDTVSWTYSVQISGLQGVAHWNITVEFGYKVGSSATITKIDSFTKTFQTGEGTFSDSGSEGLSTHIARYANFQDGVTYTVRYYVRYKFSYLGAKSGNVYVITPDEDEVLEAEDWVKVATKQITYHEEGTPGNPGGGDSGGLPGGDIPVSWVDVGIGALAGVTGVAVAMAVVARRRRR